MAAASRGGRRAQAASLLLLAGGTLVAQLPAAAGPAGPAWCRQALSLCCGNCPETPGSGRAPLPLPPPVPLLLLPAPLLPPPALLPCRRPALGGWCSHCRGLTGRRRCCQCYCCRLPSCSLSLRAPQTTLSRAAACAAEAAPPPRHTSAGKASCGREGRRRRTHDRHPYRRSARPGNASIPDNTVGACTPARPHPRTARCPAAGTRASGR